MDADDTGQLEIGTVTLLLSHNILAAQDHPIPVNLLIRWKLPTRQTPAADRQKVARAPKQLPAHGLVTPNLLDKGRL